MMDLGNFSLAWLGGRSLIPRRHLRKMALLNVKNIRILVTAFAEGKILFRHGDMETRSQLITSLCDGYLDDGMLI